MARGPISSVVARGTVVALAGLALAAGGAQACTKTWASGSGSWATSSDWSPAGMPGPDDDVCITAAGSYTVSVPVLNGGAQVRSLTVGGTGGGTQTLAIVGGSAPLAGGTLSGTSLNASAGGTIGATGQVVLDATDQGIPPYPNVQTGGSATLSGGPFTNSGTLTAQAETMQQYRDYLRVPFTNQAGGVVEVTSGLLDYAGGLTFQNDGTLRGPSGTFLLETELPASGARTHLVNAGSVVDSATWEVDNAAWTQAGGSVTGFTMKLLNSTLDYQAGTGSFSLTNLFDAPSGSLAGTIPAGQTVTAQGGAFGDNSTNTLPLVGDQVVNRGTLVLNAVSGGSGLAGGASVQGAPLLNYGTILATNTPDLTGGKTLYPDYIRSDLTNEQGGVILVESLLTQDAGTSTLNAGTVELSGLGVYEITRNATAARASSFTNAAGAVIIVRLDATSMAPWFSVSAGAMFDAGGELYPLLTHPFAPRQGREFRLIELFGGATSAGQFDQIGDAFSADYAHAESIRVVYGLRAGPVVGGRGSFAVALVCPPGPGCPRVLVRATAPERVRVATGKGAHRKTHLRTRRVVVAIAAPLIAAGRSRSFAVQLNGVGRRLLAHAPGSLAVQVVMSVNGRPLAKGTVRVRRL